MASYYNRTRGTIALSLTGNNSVSLAPKRSIILEGADEMCESVLRAVSKGDLVQRGVKAAPASFPVAISTPSLPVSAPPAPPAFPVVRPVPSVLDAGPVAVTAKSVKMPEAEKTEGEYEVQIEPQPKAAVEIPEPTGEEPRRRSKRS